MKFKPTEDQLNAINSKGQILVSAAAGSGKTAVLVEKIVSMIIKNEISADKIMVVTFTNAAAAEFKARIDARIQEELINNYSSRLEEQMMLLSNAYIGTTDAICLRLVRENFEILGVSPTVKVIDTAEYSLMQYNILTDIFKERYNNNDNELLSLLNLFPGDIDDLQTKSILLNFYKTISIQISRENYLNSILKMYDEPNFMYWLKSNNSKYVDKILKIKNDFLNIAEKLDEDSKLLPIISDANEVFAELIESLNSNDYIKIHSTLLREFKPKWPTASKKAPEEVLKHLKLQKKAFDSYVKELKSIYSYDSSTIASSFNECKNAVIAIVDIMLEFIDKLNFSLNEKGLVSFEHAQRLALELLRKFENGKEIIPESCEYITNKFDCVMVDEYQDTNNLQDYFFNAISKNGDNLFTVGDIKQSIYRFRGANPENFKEKQVLFKNYNDADETVARKIFLKSNFRSRPEICDFINYFFEGRMTEKVGSIDYSENERLNPEAFYPKNEEYKTDIVLLNQPSDISKVELESEYISKYIIEQMNKAPFLKGDNGALRKADYKDFAIFVRNDMGNIDIYAKTLAKHNIPFSVSGNLPLRSNEVVTILSLLKLINSKNDDIAFVSATMSPLFGFTLEEIAELKFLSCGCLYDALKLSAKNGNIKAQSTFELLEKFKRLSTSVSIGELVYSILNKTYFKEIVLSFDNGKVRANNLSLFEELAFSFDKNDNYSLPAFLAYCDKIADTYSADIKPDKNENTVKIMTMHKSKGLQYPICIIALNTKKFTNIESRQSFLSSSKLGVGFKYLNSNNTQISTPAFNSILSEDREEQLSEEMRVYYVALTRAEEKLLIVLSDNFEKKLSDEKYLSNNKVNSFSDWVLDAAFSSACSNNVRRMFNLPIVDGNSGLFNLIYEFYETPIDTNYVPKTEYFEYSPEAADEIKELFSYKYPYSYLRNLTAKTSVSNLVHKASKKVNNFNSRPYFAEKGGLSSAEKGTALHKFMQYVNFNAANIDLNAEIERLYEYKYLSKDEIESLNLEQIRAFLKSDLLSRAINSEKIYKEYKFITDIPANLLDTNIPNELNEYKVIIQGAIDFLFIENNHIIIIDFKTDKMSNEEDFVSIYKEQLDYYSLACEKIFKLPVSERYIYSLNLGETIKL